MHLERSRSELAEVLDGKGRAAICGASSSAGETDASGIRGRVKARDTPVAIRAYGTNSVELEIGNVRLGSRGGTFFDHGKSWPSPTQRATVTDCFRRTSRNRYGGLRSA